MTQREAVLFSLGTPDRLAAPPNKRASAVARKLRDAFYGIPSRFSQGLWPASLRRVQKDLLPEVL